MTNIKPIPTAKGNLLLGNTIQYIRDPLNLFTNAAREHGDIIRMRLLPWQSSYHLAHPELIESVLRHNHQKYRKDYWTRQLSTFLGEGLLTSDGPFWRRNRLMAQPSFQRDQIHQYGHFMVTFAERMLDEWQDGEERDVHQDMMQLTLEIVAKALFDSDVREEGKEVGEAMEVIMDHFFNPLNWLPIRRWIPTPGLFRYRRAVRQLDRIVFDVIEKRRREFDDADDLLSRLIAAQDDTGATMSNQQLRDECITLFLAGHETTALAMSFCFYLVAQHPDVEKKLVEESSRVCGDRAPSPDDYSRLVYHEWVFREAMRLYPPAWIIGRESVEDTDICGYPAPKGTTVHMAQWVVHRDPRWYDEPDSFRPERWDNDFAKKLPRGAYFPFGDGPRICIGMSFAMLEGVLLLATVMRRFHLVRMSDQPVELLPSITLRPKGGMPMRVEKRSAAKPDDGMSPVAG